MGNKGKKASKLFYWKGDFWEGLIDGPTKWQLSRLQSLLEGFWSHQTCYICNSDIEGDNALCFGAWSHDSNYWNQVQRLWKMLNIFQSLNLTYDHFLSLIWSEKYSKVIHLATSTYIRFLNTSNLNLDLNP